MKDYSKLIDDLQDARTTLSGQSILLTYGSDEYVHNKLARTLIQSVIDKLENWEFEQNDEAEQMDNALDVHFSNAKLVDGLKLKRVPAYKTNFIDHFKDEDPSEDDNSGQSLTPPR